MIFIEFQRRYTSINNIFLLFVLIFSLLFKSVTSQEQQMTEKFLTDYGFFIISVASSLIGFLLILLAFRDLIKGRGIRGWMFIWGLILAGGIPIIAHFILSFLQGWGIPTYLAFGAIFVILGAIFHFAAYIVLQNEGLRDKGTVKILSNTGSVIIFIGIIFIGHVVILQYIFQFRKPDMLLIPCEKFGGMYETVSCIFTGYYVKSDKLSDILGFILFGIILPLAFLYTFLYGVFTGMGLQNILGGQQSGSKIVAVLSFIIALYGARQLVGMLLLDLLAYGAWGGVVVFAAVVLANIPKFIIDKIVAEIKTEVAQASQEAISKMQADLNNMNQQLNKIGSMLDALLKDLPNLKTDKDQINTYLQALIKQISELVPKMEAMSNAIDKMNKEGMVPLKSQQEELLRIIFSLRNDVFPSLLTVLRNIPTSGELENKIKELEKRIDTLSEYVTREIVKKRGE